MLSRIPSRSEKGPQKSAVWTSIALTSLLLSQLALAPLAIQAEEATTEPAISTLDNLDVNQLSPRDNLFRYANYAWILDHPLEGDTTSITTMDTVSIRNQRLVNEDLTTLVNGELEANSPELKEFVKLQKLLADSKRREEDGVNPILAEIKQIEDISDLAQLNQIYPQLIQAGYSLPVNFSVAPDTKDVSKNMLQASEPSLYFETKDVYDDAESLKTETETFQINRKALLEAAGYDSQEAQQYVADALAFDLAMSSYLRSAEELAVSTNFFNPTSLEDLAKHSKNLDIKAIVKAITPEKVQTVNLSNPNYFKHLDELISQEKLPQIKAWLIVNLVNDAAPYLNQAMQAAQYASQMQTDETKSQEDQPTPSPEEIEASNQEQATYLATKEFDQVIGNLFAQRHMSKTTKKDVTKMAETIVSAYKDRLKQNKWLSQATRKAAIEKLDKMAIYVGAPDQLPSIYSQKVVDETKSSYENIRHFTRLTVKDNLNQLGKQADLSDWGFPAYEVNAFYTPQTNAIYFPAGFLQSPIYDDANTISANYGGIGTVIGHEITHAFDSDGALYDASGNLNNWWTDKDFQAFEKKTQAMVDLWDGQEYATGTVNGELTVTENIADLGGMAVALDALKKDKKADLKDFFISYARIWGQVATDEEYLLLMATDSHSPNELRANLVPSQFEDFHKTFGTKKGDAMYRNPKDRLLIW